MPQSVQSWCFYFIVYILAISSRCCSYQYKNSESIQSLDELNKSTYDIVRLRGFNAVNHFFTTSDGYILNLVQCTNPLINNGKSGLKNRDVVLFVHGTMTNANFFVVNSLDAHPRDLSHLEVNLLSEQKLEQLFAKDPNKNSFPFLLLNLGHEVWLVNRRGTTQSQVHKKYLNTKLNQTLLLAQQQNLPVLNQQETKQFNELLRKVSQLSFKTQIESSRKGLGAINSKYWNFTFDEQISIDFPQMTDYILKTTKRKEISVVGHSNGGLIVLAALSSIPELNDKIAKVLLWAPALYVRSVLNPLLTPAIPILRPYIGPLIPGTIVPIIHDLLAAACSVPVSERTLCAAIDNLLFGFGGQQQVILPGTLNMGIDSYGSREILHFAQSTYMGKTYHFDYGSAKQNLIAYNQTKPPVYDVSKITNKQLSFWIGVHDVLVPERAAQAIVNDMGVKGGAPIINIGGGGVYFNHISFGLHRNVGNLLNIPALKVLAKPHQ